MNYKKLWLNLATALMVGLFAINANALDIEFDFTGDCDDCAGTVGDNIFESVSGTLSLTGVNEIDGLIYFNGFNDAVFSYDGSSLLNPFTASLSGEATNGVLTTSGAVTPGEFFNIGFQSISSEGPLCTSTGLATLGPSCFGGGMSFFMSSSGDWDITLDPGFGEADFGINGQLSQASVPEPSTIGLLALGLAGLALRRRKH